MKYTLALVTVLFSTFSSYSQGRIDGFYNQKGVATFVLGAGQEDTNHYYAGTTKTDIERQLQYISLYAAYGIIDNVEVSIAIPYLKSDENNNFQDLSVFLKYEFANRDFSNSQLAFSGAIGVSTPISDYAIGGLNDIGQQATILETRLMTHYKLDSGWFATLQSGFSFKLEEVPNSIPVVFKAGKALSKYYFDIYYDFQHSFGGIDYLGTPPPQNFRRFGVDYHKFGGTFYFVLFKDFGAYLSGSYVLGGRNVFAGPGYGVGLVYSLRKQDL